jgi:hypothetical protein
MIWHRVRHGRQDNHATNHVRSAKTSKAEQSMPNRQIEAKHSETIYLSNMCQWITTPAKQSTRKAPRQCLLGKDNRQARTQRNQVANRQEGMIRTDFIPALSWAWPFIPSRIMQGRPEGGGSFRNGLLHARPQAYEPRTTGVSYPAPLPR